MKKGVELIFILALVLVSLSFISAETITEDLHLNIQVTNGTGTPESGTYDFVFNISTAENCSADFVVYTNSTTLTTNDVGVISYYLPNVSLDYDAQYYLCYYKDGILEDASKIARSPYAFSARNVTLSGVEPDVNFDLGSYNMTTTGYGFFGALGSLVSRVTNIFAQDADISGNLTVGNNISFGGSIISGNETGSGAILNEQTSSTNPTLVPSRSNLGYGLGYGSQSLHLIVDSANILELFSDRTNLNSNLTVNGNVTADYFFGDGSQLTGISIVNSSYYLESNPYGFYNSTTLQNVSQLSNDNSYYNSTTLQNVSQLVNDFGFYNSTTLQNVSQLTNDFAYYNVTTLPDSSYNDSWINVTFFNTTQILGFGYYNLTDFDINDYLLSANWNATNTSYYLATNPFGFYNSTTLQNVSQLVNDFGFYNSTTLPAQGLANSTSWNRSGTNVFLANSGDSVGIGTSSPLAPLHVKNSNGVFTRLLVGGTTAADLGLQVESTTDQNFDLRVDNTGLFSIGTNNDAFDSYSAKFAIDQSGLVGIGTSSPSAFLHINGSNNNKIILRDSEGVVDWAIGSNNNDLFYVANISGGTFPFGITSGAPTGSLRISSTGDVGIGTSTPSAPLHISANSDDLGAAEPFLIIQDEDNTAGSKSPTIGFANDTGGIIGKIFVLDDAASNDGFRFVGESGSDLVTFAQNGNVGIGTGSPNSNLDIQGSFAGPDVAGLQLNNTGTGGLTYALVSSQDSWGIGGGKFVIRDVNNDQYRFVIDSSGRVGIGTSSPSGLLDVTYGGIGNNFRFEEVTAGGTARVLLSPQNTAGNNASLVLRSRTSGGSWDSGGLIVENGNLKFYSDKGNTIDLEAQTPDMVIQDGNVGIGTSSPGTTLEVSGSATNPLFIDRTTDDGVLTSWRKDGTNIGQALVNSASSYFHLYANAGNSLYLGANGANSHLVVNSTGNVGIGETSPTNKLEIRQDISSEYSTSTSAWAIARITNNNGSLTNPAAGIRFEAGNSSSGYGGILLRKTGAGDGQLILTTSSDSGNTNNEALSIDHQGRVGIGTITPNTTLTIQGLSDNPEGFFGERIIYMEQWSAGEDNLAGDLGTWTASGTPTHAFGCEDTQPYGNAIGWSWDDFDNNGLQSPGLDLSDYAPIGSQSGATDSITMTDTRVFIKGYICTDSTDSDAEYMTVQVSPDNSTWYEIYRDQSNEDGDTDAGFKLFVADLTNYINGTSGASTYIRFVETSVGNADYSGVGTFMIYESDVPTNLGLAYLGYNGIGIGTRSPDTELHVEGDITLGGTGLLFEDSTSGGSDITLQRYINFNNNDYFAYNDSTNTYSFSFDSTTPSISFMDGAISASSFVGDGSGLTNLSSSSYWTASGLDLYNDTSGIQVGIGTSSPQYKLDVNGSVKSSETFIFPDGSTQQYAATPDGIGWHVTTALFNQLFSVASQETSPNGIFFKPDGTKMYVLGDSGNDINEYNLSNSWNVSSASFFQVFSVSTEQDVPTDFFFRQDGMKMYVIGDTGDEVNEYDLSEPWDISSASFVQVISVNSEESAPRGIFFKPDGTKMYVLGTNVDEVNEYDLSDPWNISSAIFNQLFSVTSQESNPLGIFFKPDGTKMYIVGAGGVEVNEYDLSEPWDISSASFVQVISVNSEDTFPSGIFFKPDGTKMYLIGGTDDEVHEYDLGIYILGNVGIGTRSPQNTLNVIGDGNFSGDFYIGDEVDNFFVDGNTGQLGIGTNNPNEFLHILDSGYVGIAIVSDSSTFDPFIRLTNNSFSTNTDWYISMDTSESEEFQIGLGAVTDDNSLFTIETNGNIGIGTETPGSRLHASNTGSANDVLLVQDSSGTCEAQPTTTGLTWSCSSDERLKENIEPTTFRALDYLLGINLYEYDVKKTGEHVNVGPIAQEVIKDYPELVNEYFDDDLNDTAYSVSEPGTWTLVKAIGELKSENDLMKESLCNLGATEWC